MPGKQKDELALDTLVCDGPIPPPSYSVGSAGHADGTCRPCAWNRKPLGCVKGSSCEFCHLCEEGELKRQKLDKRNALKAARQVSSAKGKRFAALPSKSS